MWCVDGAWGVGDAIGGGLDKLYSSESADSQKVRNRTADQWLLLQARDLVLQPVNGLKTLGPYQGRPKQHVEQQ